MTTLTPDAKAAERFWTKVDKTETCWNWTAGKKPNGYGKFWHKPKNLPAHRFSFELAHGAVPAGQVLDHRCRNRACVNPEHLRLVTNKQNTENRSRQSWGSSGIRGVTPSPTPGKWMANVRHLGKLHNVGTFANIADAEAAAIAKRNELFTHNDADRTAV